MLDFLNAKDLMFSSLKQLDNTTIHNKTKITLYEAIDLSKQYWLIIIYPNSTRIIKNQLETFLILQANAIAHCGHNFAVHALLFDAPICSKVKANLKTQKWKLYNDFM